MSYLFLAFKIKQKRSLANTIIIQNKKTMKVEQKKHVKNGN